MKKVIYFLLLLYIGSTECLEGNNKSLCYTPKRVTKSVDLGGGKSEDITKWEKQEHCCPGYKNIANTCTPICIKECIAGECIEPNKCNCHDGFEGDDCSIPVGNCVDGWYGEECDQPCQCNGSPCNRSTGQCKCKPGWIGNKCEYTCPKGKFGLGCKQSCICQRGHCNPENGECKCPPGFTTHDCSEPCNDGWYGEECEEPCICVNGAKCNHVTGECICSSGYEGPTCSSKCKYGKWGDACLGNCNCKDDPCDVVTGDCQCKPGYKGKQCEEICDAGSFGKNCSQICSCVNGNCSHIDGTCKCNDGWTGMDCAQKNCTDWTYGFNCEEKCICDQNNSKSCDLSTGNCFCKKGWIGNACLDPCPDGYYGENCSKKCKCVQRQYESCDKETGRCFCKKEWKGQWCGVPCDCQNGGECDPNGRCNCTAGWTGENCSETCRPHYFGKNCSEICLYSGLETYRCDRLLGDICAAPYEGSDCEDCPCEPNGHCNTTTGSCDCHPGYYGLKCTSKCPEGRYGKNCSVKCQCEKCRPTDGWCPCQSNWNEALCTDYCPVEMYNLETKECQISSDEPKQAKLTFVIIIISTGLVILIAIGILVFACKRRCVRKDEPVIRESPKFYRQDDRDRASRITNTYEREEPTYEVIPEMPTEPYDRLQQQFSRRYDDPLYYSYGQYEMPRHLANGETEFVPLKRLNLSEHDRQEFIGPTPIVSPYTPFIPDGRRDINHIRRDQYPNYAPPTTFQRWK